MNYNTSTVRNETFRRAFIYKPGGTVANLTGCTARMQLRDTVANTLVIEFSTTNGRIILGTTGGEVTWLLPVADCLTTPVNTYNYDMVITLVDGTKVTPLRGQIEFLPEVTV